MKKTAKTVKKSLCFAMALAGAALIGAAAGWIDQLGDCALALASLPLFAAAFLTAKYKCKL